MPFLVCQHVVETGGGQWSQPDGARTDETRPLSAAVGEQAAEVGVRRRPVG